METQKVNIIDLSRFVIIYCTIMGNKITPLKLQKLLYYIQAFHLVQFKKNNIFDETPEAWVNGPVYRIIYNEFKDNFLKNSEFKLRTDLNLEETLSSIKNTMSLNEQQENFLINLLQVFGKLDDERLVLLTHSEKPWIEARKDLGSLERSSNQISLETMYSYYNDILNKNNIKMA